MRVAASALMLALTVRADAAVLCAKPSRDGSFNGGVKIRAACKPSEVQLAPADVGFCCGSVTTVPTTTTMCPTFTTTTLGIQDCSGGAGFCVGLCANGRACIAGVDGSCGCTGPELPCGVVTAGGACGGACPNGFECALFSPSLPNGCPDAPRCGCVSGTCSGWGGGCDTGLPGSGPGRCCPGLTCRRMSSMSDLGVCGGGTCTQPADCPGGECVSGACCVGTSKPCALGCCPGHACGTTETCQ
jgi:hypothetical protein